MALLTRKEFSDLAGLPEGKGLGVYISRGKVLTNGKFIDSENLHNKEWLTNQRIQRGLDASEYSIIQPKARKLKEIVIPSIANSKPKSTGPVLPPETDPDRMTKADLDLEIKRAELKKKIKEVSLLEIKELKARGEVIPTELVNSLIREMSEAMKIAYMDGIENYTVVIARQKKMSVQEEADVKKHFTELINNILKRQTYVAKRGLKSIVKAYQEIRGKGESK
jgi:hypothetical protein